MKQEGAYLVTQIKNNQTCKFLLVSQIKTSTQNKTTIRHKLEHDKNKHGCGGDAREGHNSYHHSWPHTELHPERDESRKREESRFFLYISTTELWLSLGHCYTGGGESSNLTIYHHNTFWWFVTDRKLHMFPVVPEGHARGSSEDGNAVKKLSVKRG